MITVGSNVVDVFVKTDPEESDYIRIRHNKKEEELLAYPLGSKILINHIDVQTGGGGTNTAVTFSRLGFKTAYLGKIGRDDNGLTIFRVLKQEGIDFIGSLGDQTGYSVILDSVEEDRTVLTYKGCNNNLHTSELDTSKIKAKAYFFTSLLGASLHTLEDISEIAKKQKALVMFNLSSYAAKNLEDYTRILKNSTIIVLNEEEAKTALGDKPPRILAKALCARGPKHAIITRGKNGVIAYYNKKYYELAPRKNLAIVETTGAGDAFASTLLAGLLMKKTITQSLKMAMINAESVITHLGAKNKLLTLKEMQEQLKKDKR